MEILKMNFAIEVDQEPDERIKRKRGGWHKVLSRDGWPDFVFSFHDNEEVGPKMKEKDINGFNMPPTVLNCSKTADVNVFFSS